MVSSSSSSESSEGDRVARVLKAKIKRKRVELNTERKRARAERRKEKGAKRAMLQEKYLEIERQLTLAKQRYIIHSNTDTDTDSDDNLPNVIPPSQPISSSSRSSILYPRFTISTSASTSTSHFAFCESPEILYFKHQQALEGRCPLLP